MGKRIFVVLFFSALFAAGIVYLGAQNVPEKSQPQKAKAGQKKKGKSRTASPALVSTNPFASLNKGEFHEDFPAVGLTEEGEPVVVFIENDGEADHLRLAGLGSGGGLEVVGTLASPGTGNIYQPCLTRLGDGTFLSVWSVLKEDGQWDLQAREIGNDGATIANASIDLTEGRGNDIFADLGTDRLGRAWLTWQRFESGSNQVLASFRSEAGDWSDEIQVTSSDGGNWEPRLAFGEGGEALVVFDSYRNGDFDLFLSRISPQGEAGPVIPLAATPRYEARGEAATSPDGSKLWVVYETGMERWGKDLGAEWRKKGGGLHHDREIKLISVDLASNAVEEVADITALLPDLVMNPGEVGTGAIDVPEVVVDGDGNPWVFFRFCLFKSPGFWQTAYAKMDSRNLSWTRPELLGSSAYCQDRRTSVIHDGDDSMVVAYPSDSRKNKQAGDTGIHLARIATRVKRQSVGEMPFDLVKPGKSLLEPFNDTPERSRDDHHTWTVGGEQYTLYWGDVHRHTDFSNCRTTDDGCVVEHYRYAIEAGGLDYMGTSDHTEVGKRYSDYEWWQTQKIADLFHSPGEFVSIYAYEREQKFPYGHRNVLFLERGGPIVYIKRKNYAESRWATPLPPPAGDILGDIPPSQLWDILRKHGKRAITIEHTPGGGMGTDWTRYDEIDSEFENVLELFQGSRQAFEGEGAPQPPVVVGRSQESKFKGNSAKGTWQAALKLNHRLGAYASSDHRSNNLSYGGVYVKELNRKEIFDALDARRTCAATDKIFMEFSCNGRIMGEVFESGEPPEFAIRVEGTAPIERITLVRNETDYEVFPGTDESGEMEIAFVDESPGEGENRYYVRVEQVDGNMGWTSPVWVTMK